MFRDVDATEGFTLTPVVRLVELLDETHFAILALAAIFLREIARHVRIDQSWPYAAKCLSCIFLLAYALHLLAAVDIREDVAGVMVALVRATVIAYLFHLCIAAPVVFITNLVSRYVQSEWRRLREYAKEFEREAVRPAPAPPLPQPQPIPRDVLLRRATEQARLDYEFECQIIRSAGLSEDEQEAALAQAKQKYLQRLSDAMQ